MKEKLLDVINMNPDSSFVVKISNRWELNELLECIKPLDFRGVVPLEELLENGFEEYNPVGFKLNTSNRMISYASIEHWIELGYTIISYNGTNFEIL